MVDPARTVAGAVAAQARKSEQGFRELLAETVLALGPSGGSGPAIGELHIHTMGTTVRQVRSAVADVVTPYIGQRARYRAPY